MDAKPYDLALVFTGHMIDLPGRPTPRFPPAMEMAVASAITAEVERARQQVKGPVVGISSGARGGDLLFLEACRLHGIETGIVLPSSPEEFVKRSVEGVSGSNWVDRFWATWKAAGPHFQNVLPAEPAHNAHERCNHAMLQTAKRTARQMALIAFWNGQQGDGPGGTAGFVEAVRAAGGRVQLIDAAAMLRANSAR